jgi:hypothetical protein
VRSHTVVSTLAAVLLATTTTTAHAAVELGSTSSLAPTLAQSAFNHLPPVILTNEDREFYESITSTTHLTARRDMSLGPAVGVCFALGGLTPEIAGLNRLACLLDAVQRYKLAVTECAQQHVDRWQEEVIWPRNVLAPLKAATLARVATLREHAEDLLEEWRQPESTAALAATYTTPERVTRADYERAWGASRGPNRDQGELISWLSVTNRNTIQARTSAAFGLAGELPENTWERIGREGTRMLAESRRDPLAAICHMSQMLADRARVDANTTRLEAQTLLTEQVLRDYRRAKRKRAQALGDVFLRPFTEAAQRAARDAQLARQATEAPS